MGMRGPAPKPMELVKAEGNPGHIKLNDNSPKFKPIIPKCPPWVGPAGRKEWKRLAPELLRLGLLTSGDFAAFSCLCSAWSDLVEARKDIKEYGSTYTTDKGNTVQRPQVGMKNQALKFIKDFAVQFGLTPSARGRIQLPGKNDEGNEDLD
jgi:P27 family predicted phage terminase small subunit